MTTDAPRDLFHGEGTAHLDFSDLDQDYRLKLRSYIEICMPPVFIDMERQFQMFTLRQRGVVPIFFYVKFDATPTPLSYGRKLISNHTIGLYRHEGDGSPGAGPPGVRLLLDSRAIFSASRGSGSAAALGWEPKAGPVEEVGRAQILQVFTKPLAPRGERSVTEPPPEMASLRLREWPDPYPTLERLQAPPDVYMRAPDSPWDEFISVFGMPNTDINQHVNVQEYIMQMENQFTRLAHGAGLQLRHHLIRQAEFVFRKPFFPGDLFALRGAFWSKGAETLMVAGVHAVGPEGNVDARPNVAARFTGVVAAP